MGTTGLSVSRNRDGTCRPCVDLTVYPHLPLFKASLNSFNFLEFKAREKYTFLKRKILMEIPQAINIYFPVRLERK